MQRYIVAICVFFGWISAEAQQPVMNVVLRIPDECYKQESATRSIVFDRCGALRDLPRKITDRAQYIKKELDLVSISGPHVTSQDSIQAFYRNGDASSKEGMPMVLAYDPSETANRFIFMYSEGMKLVQDRCLALDIAELECTLSNYPRVTLEVAKAGVSPGAGNRQYTAISPTASYFHDYDVVSTILGGIYLSGRFEEKTCENLVALERIRSDLLASKGRAEAFLVTYSSSRVASTEIGAKSVGLDKAWEDYWGSWFVTVDELIKAQVNEWAELDCAE